MVTHSPAPTWRTRRTSCASTRCDSPTPNRCAHVSLDLWLFLLLSATVSRTLTLCPSVCLCAPSLYISLRVYLCSFCSSFRQTTTRQAQRFWLQHAAAFAAYVADELSRIENKVKRAYPLVKHVDLKLF